MPATEPFRQLAGATVQCHDCDGSGAWKDPRNTPGGREPCPTCGGTGRVYLFPDSVRVRGQHNHGIEPVYADWRTVLCEDVGCPGWVPSEDGWVWGPAVRAAMVQSGMMESRWAERLGLAWTSGRDAFLAMLREAVLSIEGVEIG